MVDLADFLIDLGDDPQHAAYFGSTSVLVILIYCCNKHMYITFYKNDFEKGLHFNILPENVCYLNSK